MTVSDGLIGVDWGGSNVRAFRIDRDGRIVDERRCARRLREMNGGHADILFELIEPWRHPNGAVPILLSGMVGSREGWLDAGYCAVPTDLPMLARACRTPIDDHPEVRIVPGLFQSGPGGSAPDCMRGEEVQVFGAIALTGIDEGLFCLPGTHSKWVEVKDGWIVGIQTYFTGELFDLLRRHSLLRFSLGDDEIVPGEAFDAGLDRARASLGLLGDIFAVRALDLDGRFGPTDAASYLSGVQIGHELYEAMARFAPELGRPVQLICAPNLALLYDRAFARYGLAAVGLSGDDAAAAGLFAIARRIGEDAKR